MKTYSKLLLSSPALSPCVCKVSVILENEPWPIIPLQNQFRPYKQTK